MSTTASDYTKRERALELALGCAGSMESKEVIVRAGNFYDFLINKGALSGTPATLLFTTKTTDLTLVEAVAAMRKGKVVMRPTIASMVIGDFGGDFITGRDGGRVVLGPKDVTADDWQIVDEETAP